LFYFSILYIFLLLSSSLIFQHFLSLLQVPFINTKTSTSSFTFHTTLQQPFLLFFNTNLNYIFLSQNFLFIFLYNYTQPVHLNLYLLLSKHHLAHHRSPTPFIFIFLFQTSQSLYCHFFLSMITFLL
ncbi:hypothetical protein V8G54_032982, partial [Vigna mungo]